MWPAHRRMPWVAFSVYLACALGLCDTYPAIPGGVLLAALIWGAIAYARDRSLGERVGLVVADVD
jgi:hypothetical protein